MSRAQKIVAVLIALLGFASIAFGQVANGGISNNLVKLSGTTVVPASSSWTFGAAGASSTVQYNKNGALGGNTNFVYNGTNVGIGTTTPYAALSIQTGSTTGDAFVVATSSGSAVGGYDNDGHQFTSGPAPVISSCGTGTGTVVGDDESGTITTATSATTCTATFSKAYRNTPNCQVTDDSVVGFADVASVSTNAVTFGISSALTSGHLYYSCKYHK